MTDAAGRTSQDERPIPSSKYALRELIRESLAVRYIAKSCQDAVQTGNHYQSVNLGDTQTSGFRTDRSELLDQVDFRGRSVLDLGSNLGELSRAARARGAAVVDGFEFDTYFLEVARLINVYNEVSRVSFYHRDITDPSLYCEHYDIVLAFAVLIYIEPVLDRIAAITDEVLIYETHRLRGNLEHRFIRPVAQHFPHHKVLGETEWGTHHDERERRAVVAFAKDKDALERVIGATGTSPSAPYRDTAMPTRSLPYVGPDKQEGIA